MNMSYTIILLVQILVHLIRHISTIIYYRFLLNIHVPIATGSVSYDLGAILSISIIATAVISVLITSIIWSILTYLCCYKRKQRDAERQERVIYEAVDEQSKKCEEIKMHQSPAYERVEELKSP